MNRPSLPSVKSADRTADIVEQVAHAPAPVTAQQLADVLGIPPSSLSYLLGTLTARGWLQIVDRRRYAIGPTLIGLLSAGTRPMADRVGPLIRRIRLDLNETCGYFERRGDDLVAVLSETGQQALSYTMGSGDRGPLHAFAAGKAILAHLPDEMLDTYLAKDTLGSFTPYTLTDPSALRRDLEVVRAKGHALSEHEHTLGLTSVAIPVGQGESVAALSVAVPSVRFDDAVRERALALLTQARRQLMGEEG